MEKYSQNNEEEIILDQVNRLGITNGKFLDVGAFHPKVFSNTRALYENGWTGVIVEPSPICFNEFKREYEFDPKMTLLNLAISSENNEGLIDFYESNGDAVSTTEVLHKEKWEQTPGVSFNKIQVPAMSMTNFIGEHGLDADLISIDVESKNIDLFNSIINLLDNTAIKIMCIEHDGYYDYMIAKMAEKKFRCVLYNNENLIFVKE